MNLYSRLAHLAQYQPSKTAIETGAARLTYAEFDAMARRAARTLRQAGVGVGDVVGVRLRETPEHIATLFGLMRVGAALLPLDWRGTRAEFDRVAERFKPKVLVSDEKARDWFPAMVDVASYGDADLDTEALAATVDATFVLSLTSGTTGEPKVMPATHEQLLVRCFNRALMKVFVPEDRFLTTLPLAYPAGREHAMCVILIGASLAMIPPLFEPAELIEFVNSRGITALNLSPNMSRAVIAAKNTNGGLLMPNLRVLVSTTGKLQPEERAEIRKRVAPDLIDYYGSTATGPIAILARQQDEQDPTAVGRFVLGMEVEVADETGNQVPQREVGRIRVRGPAVSSPMPGAAEAAGEGYHGGWFYPGDLGSVDADGVLHIHGRAADLIKRGGLMVHAQEVEQALRRHAAVADAAVVGAPSPDLGQEVVAFVIRTAPVEAKELVHHCRRELAPYKIPTRFQFVEALPRNANGKVVKGELLSLLADATELRPERV